MVKSYTKLIGIFQGKQEKHNVEVLKLLYDNGPSTAWEMAGRISRRGGTVSLHATLNKRLRSLENKGYVERANKKWCLKFKGIIAALLIQKTPRPLSVKWAELMENYAKWADEHYQELSDITIQGPDFVIHPLETIKKAGRELRLKTLEDWVETSVYVKGLIQTGVVNLDVISNETLWAVIWTQLSSEQRESTMKEWNFKKPT